MKLFIIGLILTCMTQFTILYEADRALYWQLMYLRAESFEAYRTSCLDNTTSKVNSQCLSEALDYIDKFLPNK